uniref:Cytochrome c oxidase polypeptide II n=1 Tax=Euplotes vanleeuwenhoeki TaxID=2794224 RepID=A0A7T1C544_9SPIT|nr:Cytochrome c oxidase subunit 2 precursor [Euplotes vanleeuwenhoeki]QPM99239.1 Cytochrome c oxidase subunit 2 precursor [Euplotes vanleeuwenhoeki]
MTTIYNLPSIFNDFNFALLNMLNSEFLIQFNNSILNININYTEPKLYNTINFYENYQISYLSVPNIKLYYPEPFIASPTFSHDDIWFLHITIYQYWLWFFFCFLIIFFFITFLVTIRWCNVRHKPVRETRGVSRSKCGDLITATVPVSWAASIIVHESTDAIELADGFGTSELAIGIRAYQWGWEYYYPKDLNLMLNERNTTIRLGKSLAYWNDLNSLSHSYKFKSFIYNSSASSSNNYFNYSYLTNQTGEFFSTINAIDNKLMLKISTNLITSPHIFSINRELINITHTAPTIFYNLSPFAFLSGKSQFRRNIFDFVDSESIFSNNFSNLNFIDFKNFQNIFNFNNPLNFIIGSRNILNSISRSDIMNISIGYFSEINSRFFFDYNSSLISYYTEKEFFKFNDNYIAKLNNVSYMYNLLLSTDWFFFFQYANVDMRRWTLLELLEDSIFSEILDVNYFLNFNYELTNINHHFSPYSNFDNIPISSNTTASNTTALYLNTGRFTYKFLADLIVQMNFKGFFSKKLTDKFLELSKHQFLYNIKFEFLPLSIYDISSTFSFKLPEYNVLALDNEFYKWTELELITPTALTSTLLINSPNFISNFKNLITSFQAFWKVFKTSMEEERSNYNFSLLSYTESKLPIIHDFDSILTNRYNKSEGFNYTVDSFKHLYKNNATFTNFNPNLAWNYFLFKFPFLISFDSDVIRYTWFDWYSTRGQIVTKSLDTSVFNLYGVKDFDYSFTYPSSQKLKLINTTDNFYSKFSQARNYYIPGFHYMPIFFTKFISLSNEESTLNIKSLSLHNSQSNLLHFFNINKFLMHSLDLKNIEQPIQLDLNPFNLNNKKITNTLSLLNNQTDTLNDLLNISSRRQYILSLLFTTKNNLNLNLTPLFTDNHVNSISLINHTQNLTLEHLYKNSNANFITRNPYQPLKKGIQNMIRIQADKAIAMPTDTRLQILAVSKDIIHSWSIPSAGIKIDCIPGYSSHRILLFTLSGIYWGQCMEICGRFHHWMPIVVYFIRRDLFCIWCIHFVFKNQQVNSIYQSTEHSNTELNLNLSCDYSSWMVEF